RGGDEEPVDVLGGECCGKLGPGEVGGGGDHGACLCGGDLLADDRPQKSLGEARGAGYAHPGSPGDQGGARAGIAADSPASMPRGSASRSSSCRAMATAAA